MGEILKPVGVFGGTFDPIHFGHLRTVYEVFKLCDLQQVRIVPCGQPPHRELPCAGAQQRVRMLQLALYDDAGIIIDEREIQRPGLSYMVDTLESLRKDFPGVPLCLILGSDAFLQFNTWHRWTVILELAHIIVIHRPGWSIADEIQKNKLLNLALQQRIVKKVSQLRINPAGKIYSCEVTQLDIASSTIRMLFQKGLDARYLVPKEVLNFIHNEELYKNRG